MTDKFHIWRQRFPDGELEQLTHGPTSQEGIAMAPDGKSLITSVGSQDNTVWLHDQDGDHQLSSEGSAYGASFSSDGAGIYFLMANGQTHGYELWVHDLASGKVQRVVPGYTMASYSVSRDGKQVAFAVDDHGGRSSLWVAPTDHRSSPVRISATPSEDSPHFLPDGDLVFQAIEGGGHFLYRMKVDGTGRHKITPERVLTAHTLSPDGRWFIAGAPSPDPEQPAAARAFAVDGSGSVTLCHGYCMFTWDATGKFVYLNFPTLSESTYILPVLHESGLPKLPPAGFSGIEDLSNAKPTAVLPQSIDSAWSVSVYTYTRHDTRRNLYRIQLP
jgi:WD40 repeat protein